MAEQNERLDVGRAIDELDTRLRGTPKHDCILKRCLHRASAAQRTPAIANARKETQLKRIRDVQSTAEADSLPDLRKQLKRCLAVGILEVLAPQPEAMNAQEQLSPGMRNARDFLEQIV